MTDDVSSSSLCPIYISFRPIHPLSIYPSSPGSPFLIAPPSPIPQTKAATSSSNTRAGLPPSSVSSLLAFPSTSFHRASIHVSATPTRRQKTLSAPPSPLEFHTIALPATASASNLPPGTGGCGFDIWVDDDQTSMSPPPKSHPCASGPTEPSSFLSSSWTAAGPSSSGSSIVGDSDKENTSPIPASSSKTTRPLRPSPLKRLRSRETASPVPSASSSSSSASSSIAYEGTPSPTKKQHSAEPVLLSVEPVSPTASTSARPTYNLRSATKAKTASSSSQTRTDAKDKGRQQDVEALAADAAEEHEVELALTPRVTSRRSRAVSGSGMATLRKGRGEQTSSSVALPPLPPLPVLGAGLMPGTAASAHIDAVAPVVPTRRSRRLSASRASAAM